MPSLQDLESVNITLTSFAEWAGQITRYEYGTIKVVGPDLSVDFRSLEETVAATFLVEKGATLAFSSLARYSNPYHIAFRLARGWTQPLNRRLRC